MTKVMGKRQFFFFKKMFLFAYQNWAEKFWKIG